MLGMCCLRLIRTLPLVCGCDSTNNYNKFFALKVRQFGDRYINGMVMWNDANPNLCRYALRVPLCTAARLAPIRAC